MTSHASQTTVAEYQALINGFTKHATNISLTLASQTYTTSQIAAVLQSLVSSGTSVLTTRTAWHDAVLDNRKVGAQYASFMTDLRAILEAMYSNSSSTLADFGMTPRKARAPLSTEALAARAAKAKATRTARGTTGKKAKAAVHGNVSGVIITPVTTGTVAAAPSTTSPSSSVAVTPVTAGTTAAATSPVTPTTSSGVLSAGTTPPHA